jgi:lysyl-tRNA synthetase class 1
VYQLSEITPEGDFYAADFQLVATIAQLPHLDLNSEVEKRKGSALTPVEQKQLKRRVQAAQYWVEHYASPEERIVLQDTLPERAQELTASQRAFLHQLAAVLPTIPQEDSALQTALFDVARLTPIAPAQAFNALYRVLLDRDSGPKAGNLLAFLNQDFMRKRFQEVSYDQYAFWQETGISQEEFETWLGEQQAPIKRLAAEGRLGEAENGTSARLGIVECVVELDDNKTHMKRVLLGEFTEQASFEVAVQAYVE